MKKITGLLMALLMVFTVVGCSSDNGEKDLLAKIKEEGKIVIGTNSGYPPYEFYDTRDGKKELVGYDIDLGEAIAKELGVELEWQDIDFDALIPSLQSAKFDIILAGMVNTEERRKSIDFSDDYYNTQTVMVFKEDQKGKLNDATKLSGKKIAAQTGTTQEEALKEVEGVEIVSLPGVSDTTAALISGKVDGLVIAEVSAKNIVENNEGLAYEAITGIDDALLYDGASAGIPKGEKNLQDEINKIIKKLKDSGELDKMFVKNTKLYDEVNK